MSCWIRGAGSAGYRLFNDGAAPTLLLCAEELARPGERLGQAEVLGVGGRGRQPLPARGARRLAGRGLRRVFVEGGGVTVSRFLAAGCLNRLQITVAPLIIGSGPPEHHPARDRAAERRPAPEVRRTSSAGRPVRLPPRWLRRAPSGSWRRGGASCAASRLPAPGAGEVLVETLASGISRGTETLVFQGRVPASQHRAMRAPFQAGEFTFPVKYGYSSVGIVADGAPELRGRRVFCLHPHQDRYVVPRRAAVAVPDACRTPARCWPRTWRPR